MPILYGSYLERGYRDPSTFVYPKQSELLALINESLNPFVEEVTIKQLDLMSMNADGSLRSSTGRLAAPELGSPPVRETPKPDQTAPVESDPVSTGPVDDPPEPSAPEGSQPPASEPPPPDPPAAETGEETADWGETPD